MDPLEDIYDALEQDAPERALLLAQQSIVDYPEDPVLLYLAGLATLELGQFQSSIQYLEASTSIDPEDGDVLADLGLVYFLNCQFAEAEKVIQKALRLDDRLPDAHYVSGLLLERQENFEAAVDAFETAHTIDPERYALPLKISDDEFKKTVMDCAQQVGHDLKDAIIQIRDILPAEFVDAEGVVLDPTSFGVKKDQKIYLFKNNLLRESTSKAELEAHLIATLQHED